MIVGFEKGADTYLEYEGAAQFYQTEFGPALSLACTGHLDNVEITPQVRSFFYEMRELPTGCEGLQLQRTGSWNSLHFSSLYLYLLAALSWTLFGFDWSSLFFAAGILTAFTALGAYVLVRCFTGSRLLAFALSWLVVFNDLMLLHVPHLRDFSKACLIFLALGMVGRVVTRPMSLVQTMLWVAGAGVVIALGKGFRSDVVLVLPIGIFVFVLLALTRRPLVGGLKTAALRIAFLIGGYIIGGLPVDIINAIKPFGGVGIWHVLILGFAEQFFNSISMQSVDYSILRAYQDENVMALVGLYQHGHGEMFYWGQEYESISRGLFVDLLASLPLDVLMRVVATANHLGSYPLNHLVYGPILVLILGAGAVTYWRGTLLFIAAAGAIIAFLSLQVAARHNFYTLVLGAAALGLAATILIDVLLALAMRRKAAVICPTLSNVGVRGIWAGGAAAAAVIAMVGAAFAAESVQVRALDRQQATYESFYWQTLQTTTEPTRVSFDLLSPDAQAISSGNTVGGTSYYGFMRVQVSLAPGMIGVGSGMDADWVASPGSAIADNGLRFSPNGQMGYQFISRVIPVSELALRDEQGYVINARMSGVVSAGWGLGVQRGDGSSWIDFKNIPPGASETALRFQVPADVENVRLVFEATEASAEAMHFDEFEISSDSVSDCVSSFFTAGPVYRNPANDLVFPSPQAVRRATSVTYYLPYFSAPGWAMTGIELNGIGGQCVTDVSIARAAPARTLPLELLVTEDTRPSQSRRATWWDLAIDFARPIRPVFGTYR